MSYQAVCLFCLKLGSIFRFGLDNQGKGEQNHFFLQFLFVFGMANNCKAIYTYSFIIRLPHLDFCYKYYCISIDYLLLNSKNQNFCFLVFLKKENKFIFSTFERNNLKEKFTSTSQDLDIINFLQMFFTFQCVHSSFRQTVSSRHHT